MEGRWVTINGAKVFLNSKGDVIMGMGKKAKDDKKPKVGHISVSEFNKAVDDVYPGDDRKAMDKRDEVVISMTNYIRGASTEEQDKFIADTLSKMNEDLRWSDGNMYRGITLTEKQVNSLSEGMEFESRELSSWTSSKHIANRFTEVDEYENKGQVPVLLVDRAGGQRKAISIRNYSDSFADKSLQMYKDEDEVLSFARKHTIVSIAKNRDGVYTLEVEEVR